MLKFYRIKQINEFTKDITTINAVPGLSEMERQVNL